MVIVTGICAVDRDYIAAYIRVQREPYPGCCEHRECDRMMLLPNLLTAIKFLFSNTTPVTTAVPNARCLSYLPLASSLRNT